MSESTKNDKSDDRPVSKSEKAPSRREFIKYSSMALGALGSQIYMSDFSFAANADDSLGQESLSSVSGSTINSQILLIDSTDSENEIEAVAVGDNGAGFVISNTSETSVKSAVLIGSDDTIASFKYNTSNSTCSEIRFEKTVITISDVTDTSQVITIRDFESGIVYSFTNYQEGSQASESLFGYDRDENSTLLNDQNPAPQSTQLPWNCDGDLNCEYIEATRIMTQIMHRSLPFGIGEILATIFDTFDPRRPPISERLRQLFIDTVNRLKDALDRGAFKEAASVAQNVIEKIDTRTTGFLKVTVIAAKTVSWFRDVIDGNPSEYAVEREAIENGISADSTITQEEREEFEEGTLLWYFSQKAAEEARAKLNGTHTTNDDLLSDSGEWSTADTSQPLPGDRDHAEWTNTTWSNVYQDWGNWYNVVWGNSYSDWTNGWANFWGNYVDWTNTWNNAWNNSGGGCSVMNQSGKTSSTQILDV